MINRQSLLRFAHRFNLILLIIATVFCLWSNAAFAHRPHDVISQVEVSPDFQTDNTVYILVRNNFYKYLKPKIFNNQGRLTNVLK